MSLNRKNCLAFGFFRHIFVSTPSPTNTRPCSANGYQNNINRSKHPPPRISKITLLTCPELPKQFSTMDILRAFASLFTEIETVTLQQNTVPLRYEELIRPRSDKSRICVASYVAGWLSKKGDVNLPNLSTILPAYTRVILP